MSNCKALLKHELHTGYMCPGLYDTLYTDPVLSGKISDRDTKSAGSTVAASHTAKGESCTRPRSGLHRKALTKALLVVNGHKESATTTTETHQLHDFFRQESLIL